MKSTFIPSLLRRIERPKGVRFDEAISDVEIEIASSNILRSATNALLAMTAVLTDFGISAE